MSLAAWRWPAPRRLAPGRCRRRARVAAALASLPRHHRGGCCFPGRGGRGLPVASSRGTPGRQTGWCLPSRGPARPSVRNRELFGAPRPRVPELGRWCWASWPRAFGVSHRVAVRLPALYRRSPAAAACDLAAQRSAAARGGRGREGEEVSGGGGGGGIEGSPGVIDCPRAAGAMHRVRGPPPFTCSPRRRLAVRRRRRVPRGVAVGVGALRGWRA